MSQARSASPLLSNSWDPVSARAELSGGGRRVHLGVSGLGRELVLTLASIVEQVRDSISAADCKFLGVW